MKLQPPKLLDIPSLTPIQKSGLEPDISLEQVYLQSVDATGIIAKSLGLDEAVLSGVTLAGARLERLSLTDVRLRTCDLSTARCPNSSWGRVQIAGTRLTGVDLSRGTLKDVVFEGCKLDMANFRFAKLTRVRFVDCILTEADFLGAELTDVAFSSSHLEKTEFAQCKIKNVDMRGSRLFDVRGWQSLKGITIDSMQLAAVAPQLALELGLKVDDE